MRIPKTHTRGIGDGSELRRSKAPYKARRGVSTTVVAAIAVACGGVAVLAPTTSLATTLVSAHYPAPHSDHHPDHHSDHHSGHHSGHRDVSSGPACRPGRRSVEPGIRL